MAQQSEGLITDSSHGSATPGFFFLAPIVPDPPRTFPGVFEPRLAPVVRIDRIDPASGATIAPVALFTGDTTEKVRRNPRREYYIVRWRTGLYELNPAHAYRLSVLVAQKQLGVADVRVVRRSVDLASLNRRQVVGVKMGDVLPIKFRIERTAVDRDGDGVFDWEDNCPAVANPPVAPLVEAVALPPPAAGCERGDCEREEVDCVKIPPPKQVDTDGDGAGDVCDDCPSDPAKTARGACGCGIAETDTDSDQVPDCNDACPTDPGKVSPGVCGCLVGDTDADGDGVPDCNDLCPADPAKAAPGVCGCGIPEADGDGDGVLDCVDLCPADPLKVEPGLCDCGHPEGDSDADGVPNCRDDCPSDPTRSAAPCRTGPTQVDLTWMTISNIYAQIGALNILIDGYITRIPKENFHGGGGGLMSTTAASVPDVPAVTRVLGALGGPSLVNLLLTGHSHFDHSFDTATWSALTNAPIMGSKTTCLQAQAQHIPAERCTVVVGGETITLADGVTMRVIRWNHSGDSVTNPEQHDAIELEVDSPFLIPDPVNGGLHAGVAEAFPNGGGGRAFLFTIDGADGPFSWFFQNSAGAADIDVPIVVGGVNYGAPIENLKAALADAGLQSVDLWVGSVNAPVARLLPIIKPKAFLPVHWDDFYVPFFEGARRFSDSMRIVPVLTGAGVKFLTPTQKMDKWRLSRGGVEPIPNATVKEALGFK